MKKITLNSLLVLCALLLNNSMYSQTLIKHESFEDSDYSGYTTSVLFMDYSGSDYFLRGNNDTTCPTCWTNISNYEGSNFLLWEDFDGHIGGDGSITITLDPINISNYLNMELSIGMAAPNATYNRYEAEDFIMVEYQVDGGTWTRAHYASGGPETASEAGRFRYDDNRDGFYNAFETVIETEMVYFNANLNSISGSSIAGTSMNIRVTTLSGVQEEMAIDNIRLTGTFTLSAEDNVMESLAVYPNPAYHTITLSNPKQLVLNNVNLYDLRGRLVKSIPLNSGSLEETMDISNLEAGVYLLEIQSNNGTLTKKMIKK
ncbi:T9SS type A sorting domain-containing protein [Lacinutrix sp. MEBiC02404]